MRRKVYEVNSAQYLAQSRHAQQMMGQLMLRLQKAGFEMLDDEVHVPTNRMDEYNRIMAEAGFKGKE